MTTLQLIHSQCFHSPRHKTHENVSTLTWPYNPSGLTDLRVCFNPEYHSAIKCILAYEKSSVKPILQRYPYVAYPCYEHYAFQRSFQRRKISSFESKLALGQDLANSKISLLNQHYALESFSPQNQHFALEGRLAPESHLTNPFYKYHLLSPSPSIHYLPFKNNYQTRDFPLFKST